MQVPVGSVEAQSRFHDLRARLHVWWLRSPCCSPLSLGLLPLDQTLLPGESYSVRWRELPQDHWGPVGGT